MNLSSLQKSIKITLGTLTKVIKQVPADKQTLLTSRVNSVLSKYINNQNNPSQQQLKKFKAQLDFNLNFIKLSHPNLDFKPPIQQQLQPKQKENNDSQASPHKVQLMNQQMIQIQRVPNDVFDTSIQREKNVRGQVEFSNWFEGNVDPEQLQKHKKLLQRQFFSGDYWKDKQKPSFSAKEYLKTALQSVNTKEKPQQKQEQMQSANPQNCSQANWEKIKR